MVSKRDTRGRMYLQCTTYGQRMRINVGRVLMLLRECNETLSGISLLTADWSLTVECKTSHAKKKQ